MAATTSQKLKIREGFSLLTIHAPIDFEKDLGPLPRGVTLSPNTKAPDQVHWFVKDKAQMEKEVEKVMAHLQPGVLCWIYYPKGSSKIQTDLTRDKGWDALMKHPELHWVSLISFNTTWSTFGMRLKTEADRKKDAQPKERPIFNYIDAVAKTITLPGDFDAALQGAKNEKAFFDSLSFTNRKEYVEWIVTARREETRANRVKQSVERLGKGWKNPANR